MIEIKFNEPLNPQWSIDVMIFKPTDDVEDIKAKIKPTEDPIKEISPKNGDASWTHTSKKHFYTKHYALLFEPREYRDCVFEVGYYVQMAGLGKDVKGENAVRFIGKDSGPYVKALNRDMPMDIDNGGSISYNGASLCLDTFWRSAKRFNAVNTQWAASQAAPIRRATSRINSSLDTVELILVVDLLHMPKLRVHQPAMVQ